MNPRGFATATQPEPQVEGGGASHRPRRRVHDRRWPAVLLPQTLQQFPAFRCIMDLPRGQRERQGRSSIRGNQMNLGGPANTELADALQVVFSRPRAVRGYTLMLVQFIHTASSLMPSLAMGQRSRQYSESPLPQHCDSTSKGSWRLIADSVREDRA